MLTRSYDEDSAQRARADKDNFVIGLLASEM